MLEPTMCYILQAPRKRNGRNSMETGLSLDRIHNRIMKCLRNGSWLKCRVVFGWVCSNAMNNKWRLQRRNGCGKVMLRTQDGIGNMVSEGLVRLNTVCLRGLRVYFEFEIISVCGLLSWSLIEISIPKWMNTFCDKHATCCKLVMFFLSQI